MTPDFRHRLEYKEYVETSQFTARITVLSVFTAAVMVGYLLAFYYLQVVEADHYKELAEANRMRRVTTPPPRGAILDRGGKIIARNRPAFDVLLDREQTGAATETLRALAPALGMDLDQLEERVEKTRSRPRHEPAVLASDVPLSVVAFVESRSADLPGISINMGMKRSYQEGTSGSHYLGYVGEITKAMLDRPEFKQATPGDIVGKAGVERTYNAELQGQRGEREVVVNSAGRVMQDLEGGADPVPGKDVKLTINLDMQRELDSAFGDLVGAGVFLDPMTGEILAMTSRPGYDPNFFARRFSREIWKGLVEDERHPLQNRAIQSGYSPGSTFKPIMAAAALEEGAAVPSTVFNCSGSGVFYGRKFLCHEKGGHGVVDMKKAIQVSCNIYFYNLGARLGIDAIAKYAMHVGLGERTGIDIGQEQAGLVPTPEWKLRVHKDRWYPSETISVAIGQGPLMITPLQMAVAQAFIATNGRRIVPHLKALEAGESRAAQAGPTDLISSHSMSVIRDAEWAVVNEWGTGTKAQIKGRDVCGKTGTAQVYAASAGVKDEDLPPEMRDHAWFVGFAPKDAPKVAFAVIVEHGGHGGVAAAPIVKRVLEKFFEMDERPAPRDRPVPTQVAHDRTTGARNF
ncbi:MAG TPA: penicillin-binding protein 2 [Candidatus Polarisedimenticolia bacterium]|nr:penicillin-binding protein 2 [Candidatus Polarisedimenticolia bacterium]